MRPVTQSPPIALAVLLTLILSSASTAQAETRALISTGLGGNPDYEIEFERHAGRLARRLKEVSDDVTLLSGAEATTEATRQALEALLSRLQPEDSLLIAYVGHGSWDGERFKFNVPGRDFTATDLSAWLEPARSKNQIVIVTGASSGAVQDVLAAEHRSVLTATRSGEQRNATVFGRFFTAALEDEAADINKDKRVTAIEAFHYAETGIERFYGNAGEMTTENPVASGPEPVLVLALLEVEPSVDPGQSHLYARRDELELDIGRLRENKSTYTQDDYFAELQKLLLEMAMIEAQLAGPAEGTP